jgi:hypothetical protein
VRMSLPGGGDAGAAEEAAAPPERLRIAA